MESATLLGTSSLQLRQLKPAEIFSINYYIINTLKKEKPL